MANNRRSVNQTVLLICLHGRRHRVLQTSFKSPGEKARGTLSFANGNEWEYACRLGPPRLTASEMMRQKSQTTLGTAVACRRHTVAKLPIRGVFGHAWKCVGVVPQLAVRLHGRSVTDPAGPKPQKRVLRGGAWFHREPDCRSSTRAFIDPKVTNIPRRAQGNAVESVIMHD